jgi:hypothetical protein
MLQTAVKINDETDISLATRSSFASLSSLWESLRDSKKERRTAAAEAVEYFFLQL